MIEIDSLECRKAFEEWYSTDNDLKPGELDWNGYSYVWIGTDEDFYVWKSAYKYATKRLSSINEKPELMIEEINLLT